MTAAEDFERVCALRDLAAAMPETEAWWDLRELVLSMADTPLRAWAVREIVPRIDPEYWPGSEPSREKVTA
jgi:hypothetical protein